MNDPFKILNIPYTYEIDNLDSIYYSFFKIASFQEQLKINFAYTLLKDPIQRLKYLCNHNNKTNLKFNYLEIIFKIKKMDEVQQNSIHKSLKKNLKKYINKNNWIKINTIIQFFEYLKLKI